MEKELLYAIEKLIDSKLKKNDKEYLDVQETCLLLNISKSTLYKLNFHKVIPYYKSSGGKKVYYKKTDLIIYLTKNRFMSQSEIKAKTLNYFENKEGGRNVR